MVLKRIGTCTHAGHDVDKVIRILPVTGAGILEHSVVYENGLLKECHKLCDTSVQLSHGFADLIYNAADIVNGLKGLGRKGSDLIRNNRKAAACVSRAGCLDAGVQCQKVCL